MFCPNYCNVKIEKENQALKISQPNLKKNETVREIDQQYAYGAKDGTSFRKLQ